MEQLEENQFVAVATGEAAKSFNGLIKYNKTGAYLLELLRKDQTEDSLVEALQEKYEVSEETARKDVQAFIENLRGVGLINE